MSGHARVIERWNLCMKNNPEWRKGQALMNAIYEVDKVLSMDITNEYINDCYYDDKVIHDTLAYVAQYYNETEGV